MTARPARAASRVALMTMVAGAADAVLEPPAPVLAAFPLPLAPEADETLRAALEAAYGPDLVVGEREGLPGWLVVTAAEHCSCCGHRYGGDHERTAACPCADRAAWDGAR